MPPPIRYSETPPPEQLMPVVRDVWTFHASAAVQPGSFSLPPDPCVSLAIVQAGPVCALRLVGPHARPLEVQIGPGTVVRGVRLRPEAAGAVLEADVTDWLHQNMPGDALPDLDEAVRSSASPDEAVLSLLDALTVRASRTTPDRAVQQAVAAIEDAAGNVRIVDLAADLEVGLRTLQRRFRAASGLSPKLYARARRFLLAAANGIRDNPETWGRVAAEVGFADQAHFARECRALTGLSPTAFAGRLARIEHVGVRP